MQFNIHKLEIGLFVSIFLLIISCNRKSDVGKQLFIKVNSIDKETRQVRVNTFDTIEVRTPGIGYLMKTQEKVGEYITDSSGSVVIKIYTDKNYHLILGGDNAYGSVDINKGSMINGQMVTIKVTSFNKR
ncbi:hypothetical protein ACP3T3_11270 [Chryseobacterium sp. CBSDS_008]|uniref:hypothetical protein n=1 Tax=Chryseobacterium sp. CBSDS_008 TaxID=3415265 RepID=UPI003CE6AA5F